MWWWCLRSRKDLKMKIVLISDTHGYELKDLPHGDLLVHCGDWSGGGAYVETFYFIKWMSSVKQNYTYGVVCVPGNHDRFVESAPDLTKVQFNDAGIKLLINENIEINGVKIFGTPYTPNFYNWTFMGTDTQLTKHFEAMSADTDLVISHGPPYGILDYVGRDGGLSVGSLALLYKIQEVKPKVVVFGHIHEGRGSTDQNGISYYNVSSVDEYYRPIHAPVVIDVDFKK